MRKLIILALLCAPAWAGCLQWSSTRYMGQSLTYCSLSAPAGVTGYVPLDANGNAVFGTVGQPSRISVTEGTCPATAETGTDSTICFEGGAYYSVSAAGVKAPLGGGLGVSGTGALVVTDGTPGLATGTATDCLKVNGTSGACGGGSAVDPTAPVYFDDFIGARQESTIGTLGWYKASNTGTCTAASTNVEGAHPGIVTLATSAGAADDCYLALKYSPMTGGFPAIGTGSAATGWSFAYWVKTPADIAAYTIHVGFMNNSGAWVGNLPGVVVRFDTAAITCGTGTNSTTNWMYDAYGTARTCVDSGVAVQANTWYKLACSSTALGTVACAINGANAGTISSNVPTSAQLANVTPVILTRNRDAVIRTMAVDAALWSFTGLSR